MTRLQYSEFLLRGISPECAWWCGGGSSGGGGGIGSGGVMDVVVGPARADLLAFTAMSSSTKPAIVPTKLLVAAALSTSH